MTRILINSLSIFNNYNNLLLYISSLVLIVFPIAYAIYLNVTIKDEYDYIKNKEICYNCDNKYTVKNGLVECLKNKQVYELNHTCNNFDSIYKYFDDEGEEE